MIIAQDLSKITNFEAADELVKKISEEIDLGLIIHNAGYADNCPFTKIYNEDVEAMINIDALAPYYITKAILPRLIARKHRSGILNVSSAASLAPLPGLLTYSASKVFLSYLSKGLEFELRAEKQQIDVLDYTPLGVATKMSKMRPSAFVITPEVSASHSLDDLGQTQHTFGTFTHHAQAYLMMGFLNWFPNWLNGNLYKNGVKVMERTRAKKKAQ